MAVTAAQLNVIISATGAKEVISDLNQIDGQVKKAAGGFDAFYDRIGGGAGNALRALDGVARVMGSIAIIGGVSLIAGGARAAWDQVSAVEQATVALRAYEKDASAVDRVLKELIDYARSDMGVLFQREDLFRAAQGLKMYGAETQNLTEYVKIMSRSVGTGLSTWDDLNRVIGRVGATGRLAGDDFDYLRAAGFMLDDSLRNTNITFEELFAAMDRGIPADALEGQANTIRGAMIRLQSGIRNIGLAFLDVDAETSQFVEGGLGDKLRNALFDARGWVDNFADAAGSIGNGIATAIEAVENMAAAYRSLPGWLQTGIEWIMKAVVAFGALRVAASSLGMVLNVAGLGGMIGGVQALAGSFAGAATGATTFRAALATLVPTINPLVLVMGAIIALGASWVMSYGQQKKAVDDYNQSISNLESTLESLRRQGMRSLAAQGEGLAGIIAELDETSEAMMDKWRDSVEMYSEEWERLSNFQEVSLDQQRQLNDLLNEALTDPNIDVDAWISWVTTLLTGAENAEELKANVELILSTPLSDWAKESTDAMDGLDASAQKVGATFDEVSSIFKTLPATLDDLRIDGLAQQADDVERLADAMERAFTPVMRQGAGGEYVIVDELDAANLEVVAGSWERISNALTSGDFDNARLIGDIMEVIGDPSLTLDQKADEIERISVNLADYTDIAKIAAENMQRLLEVAGMDDPLSQWNLSGNATDMSLLAMNTQQAATALDNVFRIAVSNTSAFAQQAQGVEDWITSLTIAEEGLAKLQELQNAGLITQGQYNAAMQASNDIQAANASIQQDVLAIQAMQAPIIAAHTTALADQLSIIRQLPAEQQMIALGWMDSTTAMQAMEFQTLAVAAATGQLGEHGDVVFANMIAGAAAANPYLSAILQDMGLISVGADGTITVHLSGVSEGLSEIDRLTVAMVNMLDLMDDGELNMSVSFDTLGLDDPRKKLEDIEDIVVDLDGSEATVNVGVEEEGGPGGIETGVTNIVGAINDNISPVIVPVEIQTPSMGGAGGAAGEAARGAFDSIAADVVISVSADTSIADQNISDLRANAELLTSTESTVTISADTSLAHTTISLLENRLDALEARVTTTSIDADTSSAHQVMSLLDDRLDALGSRVTTTSIDADTSSAHQVMSLLDDRLNALENRVTTTTLDANSASAHTVMSLLDNRLNTYAARVSTTALDADSSSAHEVLRLLENRLGVIDGSSAHVYLYAIDFATSTINSVSRSLSALNGRTATTYQNTVVTTTMGGIRGYADGGIVRDPVVMVGERGPELVALPYGSEVFSNSESMQMLREAASRAPMPVASSSAGRTGATTQYIDNSTHTTEYVALTESDFQQLLRKSDRGNQAYSHLSDPDAHNYGGGI